MRLRALAKRSEGESTVEEVKSIAKEVLELARSISELIYRENKILFPAVFALFSEGEWAAIAEEAGKIGYLAKAEGEWKPESKPLLPYEIDPRISGEAVEKLPVEFREMALSGVQPYNYSLQREGDMELDTGFLSASEVKGLFRALPIEVTFADANDRVRFYSTGAEAPVFIRTRTVLGRNILYCHPQRLEKIVKENIDALKRGEASDRVFWTRIGDRIVRVTISAVRDKDGGYLGAVEVVEDFTEILENPGDVLKKVVVL
ncbi:MAG: PAS domain-containing protein [Thermofilaceae archaeon]|nr:PAS domain-containing protein [Thermofilaceae archaeon]MCX8179759.1 PAS domain-containing protein [Thermofilaceae archaeon]MDW8004286.1 PAS domain-containing protein [Thermofilaceae archaeon]